ncbi:hypothetical protein AMAG_16572 [Allomyces macrogynus ATCC 38327]|uniref:BZIP domain-containing protein n=1 Tax=Allomyces macrogynus (strain ATCC 38327) TaxID=578462 RepID=A0A0L0TCR0_ALLM3|nr:hypothetical protein AMAG_16572 [Allomyces macrogynus ATCC 38327]|eukprot:KNE72527.1 hypothetical protein AMAG_16572 [Allomyces macrogynus ATCC 38327]
MDDLLEFLNLDGLRAPSGPHGAFDAMDLDVAVGIDRLPSPPVLSTPLPPPTSATADATDADLRMASSALRPSANLAIMVDGSSSSLFPPSGLALPTTPVTPASSSIPMPLPQQMPPPVSRGTLFHDRLQHIRRAPMWSDDEDDEDRDDEDASDHDEDMDGDDRMSPAVPPIVALPTPPRATAPQRARRESLPSSAAEMTSRILAAIDRDHHRAHRDQLDHDALHSPTASSHGDGSSSAESSPLSSAASSDMDEDEAETDAPMLAINPSRLSHAPPAPTTRTTRYTRSATSALATAAAEEGTLARRRRRTVPAATAPAFVVSTASAPTGSVRRSARAKRSNTTSTSTAATAAKSHAEPAPTTAAAAPPPSSAAATLKRRTRSASASPKPPPATRARARPRRGATSRRTSPARALTPVANAAPGRHSASHMLARFVGRTQTLAPSVARASDSAVAAAAAPEPKVKVEEEMMIKAEPMDASDLNVVTTPVPVSVPYETSPATPAPPAAPATASVLPSPPATIPRPTTIAAALGVGTPAPAPPTAIAPKSSHPAPAAVTPDPDDHFDPDHFDDDDEHDDDMLVDPPTGHHPSLWPPKHLNTEPFDLDETAAHLTPKERRQLRNKISARNFRQRRKQYLEHLEDQVAALRIDVSHERKHRHWAVERATVLKQKVEELATELAELKGCDAKGIVDQIEAALPKGPPPPPSPKAKPTPPPSVKTVPTAAGAPYPILAGRATTPNKLGIGKLPTPATGGLPLPPMMPGHAAQAAQAAAARPEATIRVH